MIDESGHVLPDTLDMQIETLVRNVYDRHITEHGDKFESDTEVLNTLDDIQGVICGYMNRMCWVFLGIEECIDNEYRIDKDVESIRLYGEKLIEKALLMMAVCDKYKNGFE